MSFGFGLRLFSFCIKNKNIIVFFPLSCGLGLWRIAPKIHCVCVCGMFSCVCVWYVFLWPVWPVCGVSVFLCAACVVYMCLSGCVSGVFVFVLCVSGVCVYVRLYMSLYAVLVLCVLVSLSKEWRAPHLIGNERLLEICLTLQCKRIALFCLKMAQRG